MKGRRFITLSVLGAMCAALVAALIMQFGTNPNIGAGPTFNGMTVTAWIESIQNANSEDAAITNLMAIGCPAVPYLIRAVEWKPSGLDRLGGLVWKNAAWAGRRLRLPYPEGTRHRENSKRGAMYVLAHLLTFA
jgi:hypothetical protein